MKPKTPNDMEILTGFKPRKIEWREDLKTGKITGIVGYKMEFEIVQRYDQPAMGEVRFTNMMSTVFFGESVDEVKAKMQDYFDKLCKDEFQYYFERE